MGYSNAREMAELADLDDALAWHLRGNHYPPVPLSMVEPCKIAILNALDNLPNEEIPLPEGVSWRGQDTAPTWAIVEAHHLEAFIDSMVED